VFGTCSPNIKVNEQKNGEDNTTNMNREDTSRIGASDIFYCLAKLKNEFTSIKKDGFYI